MSCIDNTPPPCPCTQYVTTGCLDTYNTDCVKYTGDAITCLQINSGDTLTAILGHMKDVVCAISPTSWSSYDYGNFSSQNITSQQDFVEFVSDILGQILGSQTPGSVTSLSSVNANIASLTTQVTSNTTFATSDGFETISGLPGPTASLANIVASIQALLVGHDTSIVGLQAVSGVALTANDSSTIDFTTSGTANHTLTGAVKLSATAGNSLTANADGLYVEVPSLSVVDTATIDLTSSGTLGHTLQAAVKISSQAGNQVSAQADGIFVPAATVNETAVTVTDTNSVNLTASGTNGHTIQADVKIDPASDNIISVTTDGLYANAGSVAIADNAVTNAKLRDSIAWSVVGRSAGTVGDPADIQAASDTVLGRNGSGNLQFGTIVTNQIGNDQVTFAKTQNVNSQVVLGRSTAGTGDIEQLTLGSNMDLTAGVLNTKGRTLIGVEVFTSSGTWTKPTGATAIEVLVVGAGGGGAGATSSAAEVAVGSGGGAGGHCKYFFTSLFGSSETVTIGAAGVGGTSINSYTPTAGGFSSFGTLAKAGGGSAGTNTTSGTTVAIVGGGSSGNNTVPAGNPTLVGLVYGGAGTPGGTGIRLSGTVGSNGLGGASILGGGGSQESYGAGGDGVISSNGTPEDGQDGAPGIVIVYSYS